MTWRVAVHSATLLCCEVCHPRLCFRGTWRHYLRNRRFCPEAVSSGFLRHDRQCLAHILEESNIRFSLRSLSIQTLLHQVYSWFFTALGAEGVAVLPPLHHHMKRFSGLYTGPYFDPATTTNITTQLGTHAYLPCKVKQLGNKSVSVENQWMFVGADPFRCTSSGCQYLNIRLPVKDWLCWITTNPHFYACLDISLSSLGEIQWNLSYTEPERNGNQSWWLESRLTALKVSVLTETFPQRKKCLYLVVPL